MHQKLAITVFGTPEAVEQQWRSAPRLGDAHATFQPAPGDRGCEIHLALGRGGAQRAQAKDELRRFKARFETGGIPRSDATPEGERFVRKFKRRPAQPLPGVPAAA